MYIHPGNIASLGIFVPSWFDSPARTAHRCLQHWVRHPYLWRHLEGGHCVPGCRALGESGRRGEPTSWETATPASARAPAPPTSSGSGVDQAWAADPARGRVIGLLQGRQALAKENLAATYVARRRARLWVDKGKPHRRKKSRDGFTRGVVSGLIGMGLTGLTKGVLNFPFGKALPPHKRLPSIERYYRGKIPRRDPEDPAMPRKASRS
ncbi:MAG: hypothetical protein IPL39_11085 [Opitutaceae bacterium]|nr:hypothetical protein [Opitutaceae bacterium]